MREDSFANDDVFLEDHIPYGSPGNPIDDCGVVEIDLVSTEVHTEYEAVEEAEQYDADYEASVAHRGESVSSEYNILEAEGELPIIIEENKAALNLPRNFEIINSPVNTMTLTHVHTSGADKQPNKLTAPPPNKIQMFQASLAGKSLDMFDSFQTSNITVNRKPSTPP